jgi:saccharopine dehydrogenase (NAD+, L-lysine-forming)
MLVLGLIREGKVPADNRVALTPSQCRWLLKNIDCSIIVQPSGKRCFTDKEYEQSGAVLKEDLSEANLLLGIKEVPVDMLLPGKTYMFFSHTKKMQPYNQKLMHAMVDKKITLIDYECLEHDDGQRIIGFGFFAGIVGAHNGIMAYGSRTGEFELGRVYQQKDYRELIHTYFGLKLPPLKIAVTGSGRVAHGILEIMNLMDVQEVEPDEYISKEFSYPVYVHLKGALLYTHKERRTYSRNDFHVNPQEYECLFYPYCAQTDILMNGVYWDKDIPRLFEAEDIKAPEFRIKTIADITDDTNGSIPINFGDCTMTDPVYGVDKNTLKRIMPYLNTGVDVMAVSNLPNELPRDASRFFGEQLIKHILNDFIKGSSIIEKATILKNGKLTHYFEYLSGYAYE